MNDHAALATLFARPDLARVLDILDGDGEETRVVGGAVRNTLMGMAVSDVDLATTAEPNVVVRRARRAGLTVIPTGIAHGTVTVLVESKPFEVTTLRRDVTTDGRHATVVFGRDFAEDARRRDFTMNALSASRDGALHDPVGGLSDLHARRVRFIGDARTRIREDYLRILRLFRFHAAYGEGPLDIPARDAAIAERHGLATLSAERINAEIAKLLVARRAAEVVPEIAETGLLGLVLGGVAYPARFAHAVVIAGVDTDAVSRLAALAVMTNEDVSRLRERLRLSNAATRRLERIAAMLEACHGMRTIDDASVDTMLFRHEDRAAVRDALVMLHTDSGAADDDPDWRRAHLRAAQAPVPDLPVSGDDFLRRGVPPGRNIGAALKTLQARWIRAGFPRDPAVLARLVDEVVRDSGQAHSNSTLSP